MVPSSAVISEHTETGNTDDRSVRGDVLASPVHGSADSVPVSTLFEITAYCDGYVTATGTSPTARRTVAADPDVIPMGSIIEIDGMGTYTVEDTGGAVRGNVIDVYIPDYDTCIKFGRQIKAVKVIRRGY